MNIPAIFGSMKSTAASWFTRTREQEAVDRVGRQSLEDSAQEFDQMFVPGLELLFVGGCILFQSMKPGNIDPEMRPAGICLTTAGVIITAASIWESRQHSHAPS